jgi:hypothetical protein
MLGVMLGVGLLQCGCGGCGPRQACPTYEVESVSASSGSSELSVAEGDGELRSAEIVAEYDADAPVTCAAALGSSAEGGCIEDGYDLTESSGVGLACVLNGEYAVRIDSYLGDLRTRGVGSYEVEDWLPPALFPTDPNASSYRGTDSSDCVQLVVEETVGGALPYPDVVTEDYLRVVRIEYDCDIPFDGSSIGSIRIVGQATFTVTADKYESTTEYGRGC